MLSVRREFYKCGYLYNWYPNHDIYIYIIYIIFSLSQKVSMPLVSQSPPNTVPISIPMFAIL